MKINLPLVVYRIFLLADKFEYGFYKKLPTIMNVNIHVRYEQFEKRPVLTHPVSRSIQTAKPSLSR